MVKMGTCNKCGREVERSVLRPEFGGVRICKDCYCGKEPKIEEPTVEVEVSEAADREEPQGKR